MSQTTRRTILKGLGGVGAATAVIFPNLSVYENLKMARLTVDRGRRMDDYLARVFALFPLLEHRLSNKGRTPSGGEQQPAASGPIRSCC